MRCYHQMIIDAIVEKEHYKAEEFMGGQLKVTLENYIKSIEK